MVRQKKRKRIAMGAMLAFFAVSGLWYFLLHFRNGAEENGLTADKKAKTEWDKTPEAGQTAKADASEKAAGSGYVPEPEQPEQSLYVFLCGCIAKEGVYCLASGSRLYEAVELAGGFGGEADETYHNLARFLVDGERIYIPSKAETSEFALTERVNGGRTDQEGNVGMPGQGKINLNTATREELMSLAGIGAAKAEDIIEYRTKVGAFASTEEIMNISGIGTAMFEKIKEHITVK